MFISEILADFATEIKFNELPKDIVEQAKITLMDALGVIISGAATQTGKKIIDFTLNLGDREESTIIGAQKRTSQQNAAFANASIAEILELDDGHRWSGLHPSSFIPPTVLALGEYRGASGREVLTAIILGYDVMGRIGKAIRLSRVAHKQEATRSVISTGTIGSFGSAVAASKILDLDASRMADSLGIAGYLTPLSMRENYAGYLVKPIHAGQSSKVGVLSAMLAEAGFGGSHEIIESLCDIFSEDINKSLITEELGEYFVISDLYYKKHASCRFSHAAVDAVLYLMENYDIKPDKVERILVNTFEVAVRVLNQYTNHESTFVTCQFSLPYILSLAIFSGEVTPQQFSEEKIKDPRIHNFAKKVKVIEDEKITKLFPDKYAAKVDISMKTGKKHSKFIDTPKGDPGNPFTVREFKEKFKSLANPILSEETINQVIEKIFRLEHMSDISELLMYLRPTK